MIIHLSLSIADDVQAVDLANALEEAASDAALAILTGLFDRGRKDESVDLANKVIIRYQATLSRSM